MRFVDADIIIDGLRKAKERYLTETEDPIEREAIITMYDFAIVAVDEVAELTEKGSRKNGHDGQAAPHQRGGAGTVRQADGKRHRHSGRGTDIKARKLYH